MMVFDRFEVWGRKWKSLLRLTAFQARKRTVLYISKCPAWKIFHKKKKKKLSFRIVLVC